MFNSDGRTSVSSTTSTGVRRNPSVRMGSSCKYHFLLSNFRIRFFLEKFRQIALTFQKQPVSKTKQAIIQLGIPTL